MVPEHANMIAMPDDESIARSRVAALRSALEAAGSAPVRLIETHISWVLLADAFAYKLKKPVRLPFLDFTTLAGRRRFCAEELRLNRRLAPSLYLDVVDVRDAPAGPAFGGDEGPVVDAAVRMRRFPDGALWSEMLAAGTLAPRHVDAMARRLAEFHGKAEVAPPGSAFASAAVHERVTRRLLDAMETGAGAARSDWPALRAWLEGQLHALEPHWDARRHAGRVRECHGDLHLANVLQLDGEPTAFDGIEFDAELRWIDVLDDMAFLAMDLLAHGRRALAFRFINAYLEASGDYDGLPGLRFHMVCRALVRSQVMGITAGQGTRPAGHCDAGDYLSLAVALCRDEDARLAITHGLPGSGKTFASQGLLEVAGAIRVRSDVERKRLFGLGALETSQGRVAGGIYEESATRRTYGRLRDDARVALGAGWRVIVDAAFLRRSERATFAALAASLGVPFAIVDCRAPLDVLRKRLELRQAGGGDASEADVKVLERLLAADEPLDDNERTGLVVVDADRPTPADDWAQQWLAIGGSAGGPTVIPGQGGQGCS
jgi:aminoglycoside phosphotransferase family enzyme/predicted kinase